MIYLYKLRVSNRHISIKHTDDRNKLLNIKRDNKFVNDNKKKVAEPSPKNEIVQIV